MPFAFGTTKALTALRLSRDNITRQLFIILYSKFKRVLCCVVLVDDSMVSKVILVQGVHTVKNT